MTPDAGNTRTRALLAVLHQPRPTVRSVAAEIGRSIVPTYRHLRRLEDEGLLTWDTSEAGQGAGGTLRPLIEQITL